MENENNPMRDRSIQEHYAPGSTFKTISALAALEEKVIDHDTEFDCRDLLRLGGVPFIAGKNQGTVKLMLLVP